MGHYFKALSELEIGSDGYANPASEGGLSLYPVAPCRVIDTRHVGSGQPFSGTLTPPVDVAGSFCGPPATAQAYVLNATVVPTGALGYLARWPERPATIRHPFRRWNTRSELSSATSAIANQERQD